MKPFLDEDFLLTNETAKKLYAVAKKLPIIDYHCHLDAKELYENKKFEDITEAWLLHDHYKWRFLRFCGVEEDKITGNASHEEKFMAYANSLYLAIGNPLYHWTHLELKRYFNVDSILNSDTALDIWNKANEMIQNTDFTPQALVDKSNVSVICTTDDPASDLKYHKLLKKEGKIKAEVLPTFRPDLALYIQKDGYAEYIKRLSDAAQTEIKNYTGLLQALENRLLYFKENGCRISDHSIEFLDFTPCSDTLAHIIFEEKLSGKTITDHENKSFFTNLFLKLAKLYAKNGITMQLHIGALRNGNTNMFEKLGADAGFDSVNDFSVALPLKQYLDTLESSGELPKTILYSLNPKDNIVLSTLSGTYQNSSAKGKVQFGTAWWFNDHREGILKQLKDTAATGALGTFIGMLTDSRSFLSYTRHEYFRRILCDYLGTLVENGEYPDDTENLTKIINGICYDNARNYFGFEVG